MHPIFRHLIHDSHIVCVCVCVCVCMCVCVCERERERNHLPRKELVKRGGLKLDWYPFLAHFTNLNHNFQHYCQANSNLTFIFVLFRAHPLPFFYLENIFSLEEVLGCVYVDEGKVK